MTLKKYTRSIKLISLLLSFIFIISILPAYATKLKTMKNKQQKINQQMEVKKQEIQDKQKEYDTTLGHLKDLEQNMDNVVGDIDSLKHKLNVTQTQMKKVQSELEKTQQQLGERTQVFRDRLVAVYLNGEVNYLDVLFSATDMHDFLVRMDLLTQLLSQDISLMKEIDTKVAEVEDKKAQIVSKKEHIVSIKHETEGKKKQLSEQTTEKRQLLTTIESQKKDAEKALDDLERESKQIAEQIRRIQAAAKRVHVVRKGGGRFVYPTPGYYNVTSPFGWRIHPILKTRRMHTGVDFGAPYGSEMVAADDGTVIYTGWNGAYGKVVIIDHGSNISTMYAHMSSFSVSDGANVKAGQKIGSVGSTGWSTGPHAHFEVRINGEPVNPMSYLQ